MPTGRTKAQRVSGRLKKQEAKQELRNKKRTVRLKKKGIKGKKQVTAGKLLNKPGLAARGQAKKEKAFSKLEAGPNRTVKVTKNKKDGTSTKTVTRKRKGVTTTKATKFNTKTGRKTNVDVKKTGSRPTPKPKGAKVKRTKESTVTGKTKVQSALAKLKSLTKKKKK
jgi:hypothetical protein